MVEGRLEGRTFHEGVLLIRSIIFIGGVPNREV